jgi:hypothetical protein
MILYLLEAASISYICLQVSSPGSFVPKISSTEWFVPGCGGTGLFVPEWMVVPQCGGIGWLYQKAGAQDNYYLMWLHRMVCGFDRSGRFLSDVATLDGAPTVYSYLSVAILDGLSLGVAPTDGLYFT